MTAKLPRRSAQREGGSADRRREDSEKSFRRNTIVNPLTNTVDVMNIALGVLVFLTSFIGGTEPRDGSHVRTLDRRLRNVIDEGLARSALFRGLVARLDGSDVIVYVELECPMSSRLFGRLTLLGAGRDRRYVNVRVSCMVTVTQQIAAIGHELRHAVEIADAPSVVDAASLAMEYRRIGFPSHVMRRGEGYESRAAIEAGHQVWAELAHTADSRTRHSLSGSPAPAWPGPPVGGTVDAFQVKVVGRRASARRAAHDHVIAGFQH
jgi:hypothetical protein